MARERSQRTHNSATTQDTCARDLPRSQEASYLHPPHLHPPILAGRFSRYASQVGSGRFKQVYRGFDEKRGLDIAWSKITAATTGLTQDQMMRAVEEISNGVGLDHPNVIRCYQCWLDEEAACINLITEFFTSGNLRDYRQRHKNLDVKAVKKWSRQVLLGLSYLHNNTSVICHGDLRCESDL